MVAQEVKQVLPLGISLQDRNGIGSAAGLGELRHGEMKALNLSRQAGDAAEPHEDALCSPAPQPRGHAAPR